MKLLIDDKDIHCAADIIHIKETLIKTFHTRNITIEHNFKTKKYIFDLWDVHEDITPEKQKELWRNYNEI